VPVHQVYQGRCPWPEYLQHHPPWRPYSFQCQPAAHVNRLAKKQISLVTGHTMYWVRFHSSSCDVSKNFTILLLYSTIQLQIQFDLQILYHIAKEVFERSRSFVFWFIMVL
jgi:hypothetical protein